MDSSGGAQLRAEREAAGVSNAELARALAVNPSTVTRLEQSASVRVASAMRYRAGIELVLAARAEAKRRAALELIQVGHELLEEAGVG